MTRSTNARLAGFMFLFYIATRVASLILFGEATGGEGTAAKLASIARHAPAYRAAILLTLLTFVDAVVLGVALYALGGLLLKMGGWTATIAATCFAVGSTYCYLFLSARSIPGPLAWLGLVVLGFWLLIKGVATQGSTAGAPVLAR